MILPAYTGWVLGSLAMVSITGDWPVAWMLIGIATVTALVMWSVEAVFRGARN